MKEARHIINKISVITNDVAIGSVFKWRARISDYLSDRFPAQLQAVLDERCPPEELITIDRLCVEVQLCSKNDSKDFEQEIIGSLKKALLNQIPRKQNEGSRIEKNNPAMQMVRAWLHYLQYGYYPWFQPDPAADAALEKCLLSNPDFLKTSLPLCLQQPGAVRRFIFSTGSKIFETLLRVFESREELPSQVFRILNKNIAEQESVITAAKAVFAVLVSAQKQINKSFFEQEIVQILRPVGREGVSHREMLEQLISRRAEEPVNTVKSREAGNEIWILNAGIVLVHPFLTVLFERLGIINQRKEIIKAEKALAVLHFLLYGEAPFADGRMILPKILCGLHYKDVLPDIEILSELEKRACEEMWLSVIEHWSALKKTSVEGLRQTFILRKGKLSQKENTWFLQIESRTEDILLERLPWNISFIKLPWMKEAITTEWK